MITLWVFPRLLCSICKEGGWMKEMTFHYYCCCSSCCCAWVLFHWDICLTSSSWPKNLNDDLRIAWRTRISPSERGRLMSPTLWWMRLILKATWLGRWLAGTHRCWLLGTQFFDRSQTVEAEVDRNALSESIRTLRRQMRTISTIDTQYMCLESIASWHHCPWPWWQQISQKSTNEISHYWSSWWNIVVQNVFHKPCSGTK